MTDRRDVAADLVGTGPVVGSAFELGQLLRHAHLSVSTAMLEGSRGLDLELRHVAALLELAAHGPLSQAQLVRESGMDKATLVRVLDDLERRGLAERGPHPTDRRAHVVVLAPHGHRALEQLATIARSSTDRLSTDMAPDRITRLVELLGGLDPEQRHCPTPVPSRRAMPHS